MNSTFETRRQQIMEEPFGGWVGSRGRLSSEKRMTRKGGLQLFRLLLVFGVVLTTFFLNIFVSSLPSGSSLVLLIVVLGIAFGLVVFPLQQLLSIMAAIPKEPRIFPNGMRLVKDHIPSWQSVGLFFIGALFVARLAELLVAALLGFPLLTCLAPLFMIYLLTILLPQNLGTWQLGNQTTVEFAHEPLYPSQPVALHIEHQTKQTLEVEQLTIQLLGWDEWQVYKGGEEGYSYEEKRFYEQPLFERHDFVIEAGAPWQQRLELLIPHDAKPTINSPEDVKQRTLWAIRVHIQPRQGQQIRANFAFRVKAKP